MKIGRADKMFMGSAEVSKMYLGAIPVWPRPASSTYRVVNVKFDGASYFDTGILYKSDYQVETKARYTGGKDRQYLWGCTFTFGGRVHQDSAAFNTTSDGVKFEIKGGRGATTNFYSDLFPSNGDWFISETKYNSFQTIETIYREDGSVWFEPEASERAVSYGGDQGNFYIGALNTDSSENAFDGEMSYIKFLEYDGTVKNDFIFVEDSNGKVSLYDKIAGTFCKNIGGGEIKVSGYTGEEIEINL